MNDLKIILRDTGAVLVAVGIITLVVAIVPVVYGERNAMEWIAITSVIFMAVGALFNLIGKTNDETKIRHAMITAAFAWLIISLISAIPFYYITHLDFLSSFFESVAGWTGTGLTMISSPSKLTHTIQFWRSFIQWIGGVGVIVLTLIVLARPGTGSFTLYRSEAREDKIHPSVISTVKTIWWIFLLYTGIGILALYLSGMPIWAAINHCMTGLATGGFSITDDSMASYSTMTQIIMVPLMIAGAIAFSTHYEFLKGNLKKFFSDVQTVTLIVLIIVGAILLSWLNTDIYGDFIRSFKYSSFQFISALTCTGFSTTNIAIWGDESKFLISLAMIVGGAAGSTAGGIKLFRLILLSKGVAWKIRRVFLPPNSTFPYKLGSKVLGRNEAIEEISEAAIVSFLWMILLIVGIFVIMQTMHTNLADSFFEVASAQGNVGLSVGITSIKMNAAAKIMLIINMWIGRLEIIPILVFIRALIKGSRII
ncbi:MAG: TrkH family potassium uptake protein [Thermoplasmata archaeon]|nr:TrkH family potassium uptake protein [Thermoplasmata archaeon]